MAKYGKENLDMEEVFRAAEEEMFGPSLSNPGFCRACGEMQEGCEPDARRYECESCGEKEVFGAAELVMMYGI